MEHNTKKTAKILDGKLCASIIRQEIKEKIATLKKPPQLTVIIVGNNPASKIYVKNKSKYADEVGIVPNTIALSSNISETDLLKKIEELNNDKNVNGILVQLPLPSHIDEFKIINAISPQKDVDGFTVENKGLLSIGKPNLIPCTPLGIITLLQHNKISIVGKNVVIVGRSNIVGKPLAQLFTIHDATVTLCHSKTKNLSQITQTADILVSAVGKVGLITGRHIKSGATVIDVAMNRNKNNTGWVGDIVRNSVEKKAKYITPVPGGIGPMTIAMLLQNTLIAYEIQNKILLNTNILINK